MRCSVCDYAMKEIGGKERISWCPSCGTVYTEMYKWIPEIVKVSKAIIEGETQPSWLELHSELVKCCYPPNER